MDWYLGNYWYLFLLLLLPLLGIFLFRFANWKNKKKNIFAEEKFQEHLFEKRSNFSKIFPLFYILATLFLILSIVDLLHGSEEIKSKQKMNNVIFLLDVSNSMNAEDIQPNRMTLAKNLMINTMAKMENDRVGIVIFAGESTSIMPLTTDYTAAETYISAIETQIMKIQGTDFLKGMQESAYKFQNIAKGSRKIVLISDGEDNEGNDEAAAKLAKKEGMMVVSVGVGSEEGAPVPEYFLGQLMGYKMNRMTGETVISKRQTKALQNIANSTGGSYIDGNNFDVAPDQIIDALNRKSTSSETLVKTQNANHYYQYPLAASLFFFILIFLFNPKRDFNI